MKINGEIALDELSNELGLEADRAQRLSGEAITEEISIFWTESGLTKIPEEGYIALANASLVSGVLGQQKLMELLHKYIAELPIKTTHAEIKGKIEVIAAKHRSTINLSRNRGVYINAHLNLLDPERTLKKLYGPHLNESEMTKYYQKSQSLLKTNIDSEKALRRWILTVHDLLKDICESVANSQLKLDLESNNQDVKVKGLISPKALSTYLKQWELFVIEKLGLRFGIPLKELSPLSEKLNELEKNKKRSWTTLVREITEAEKSGELKKRIDTTIQKSSMNRQASPDLLTRHLTISGKRPVTIEISKAGVTQELVEQFIDGFRAQLVIYDGKGIFESSINYLGATINISLPQASKTDVAQIEKYLMHLIEQG